MSSHSSRLSPSSPEVRVEYDYMSNQALGLIIDVNEMNDRPPTPPEDDLDQLEEPCPKKGKEIPRIDWAQKEKWKDLQEPFLHLPAEIHLLIFGLLNPIDAVVCCHVQLYIKNIS